MDEKFRSEYSQAMTKLLQGVGAHDEPRLPPLDATASEVLAFDLMQRSRVARRRVWLAGPEGQQLTRELNEQPSGNGSGEERPQTAAKAEADDELAAEDRLAEKFKRLTERA